MRAGYRVGIAAIVAVIALAVLYLAGSIVVVDREQQVASARVITSDGRAQPLYSLPGSVFYTVPRLEGEVEVHCRNGSTARWGYVTPNLHTRLEVQPGSDCR